MAAFMTDGPVYNSYVEAYLAGNKVNIAADAGSRTSTANYGYGPSGSAQRLRKSKNFVEGSPMPMKTISVLQRPSKAPSAKNAENLDAQHERDKAAFQRRANVYRRHAHSHYHHHAPPGSILTTFEQGHIVDRGRRKGHLHEARGVYDPVVHSYRVEPTADVEEGAAAKERPTSAPPGRGAFQQQPQAQQQPQTELQPQAQQQPQAEPQPHHGRSTTPFEHKLLQAARGSYNPLTHEYKTSPEPDYARRKEKEFDRVHGLGHGMRRVPQQPSGDPINWDSSKNFPATATTSPVASSARGVEVQGAGSATAPGATAVAPQRQRPTSAPSGPVGVRKSMAGPSWGTYNPLTHEWQVPPVNPSFAQQDTLLHRRLGMSGSSAGRTQTPMQQGVYNPILNTWTVPPANPRIIDGLSFMPATLFSRPTPATIRM